MPDDVMLADEESKNEAPGAPNAPPPAIPATVEAPPAPDMSKNAAAGAPGNGMAPTAPAAPVIAAQKDQQRYSGIGRAFHALMGKQTEYQVDDQGQTHEVVTDRKPGDFFRSLVAGALLGGAVGAREGGGSFAGGLAAGGAAQGRQQQQIEQQKRENAQTDFRQQQETRTREQQRVLMNAQVAELQSNQVARQRHSDFEDQEMTDKHNTAIRALENNLKAAGGTLAPLIVGGRNTGGVLNAAEFAQAYVKDPSIARAPQGYVRHFLDSTDTSELEWNGIHWVDASGEPVDMTGKTTLKVYDVPENNENRPVMTKGSELNALRKQKIFDPDKSYPVTPLEASSFASLGLKDEHEANIGKLTARKMALDIAETNLRIKKLNDMDKNADRDAMRATEQQMSTEINSLDTQWKAASASLDTETAKKYSAQLDEARAQLRAVREKLYPKTKIDSTAPAAANPAANPQVTAKQRADALLGKMQPGAAMDYIAQQQATNVITAAEADAIRSEVKGRAKTNSEFDRSVAGGIVKGGVKSVLGIP